MAKNYLLEYSEELATKCEFLCKSIKGNSNTVFQLRKSSSSVFANISEAQYPQSLADMLSKFKIARKECIETESVNPIKCFQAVTLSCIVFVYFIVQESVARFH